MTSAKQFANAILPHAVFADALAVTRPIASGDTSALTAMCGANVTATIERHGRGLYATAVITPPPPRESGDPALIAIVGRGDGTTKLTTLAYYVLELVLDDKGPHFTVVSRTDRDKLATWADGPLPDSRWFAEHAFELYCGHIPAPRTGVPALPAWYLWHVFGVADSVRAFANAHNDGERSDVVREEPLLLMPEIADSAEAFESAAVAKKLRDVRTSFRKDSAFAPTWDGLVQRIASISTGSPAFHHQRALPLVAEARQYGGIGRAQAYELEGTLRGNLAALGVEAGHNQALAEELFAAARAVPAETPRLARGSAPPPISTEDPVWRPIFLDASDLPAHVRAESDEAFSSAEAPFVALAGIRAGFSAWKMDETSAMARVVDSRWVFRTATAAARYAGALAAAVGESLPWIAAPQFGDETFGFGDDGTTGLHRAYVLVIRIGRVVAKLQVFEGSQALASRQILHAAMLHPLAAKIVQRVRAGLAAYWLAVAYPSNAVPALVHAPGYNAAQLILQYPFLAHGELPEAMTVLGDNYIPAARALASFQANLRAHRWGAYRDAMLALVRQLLASDVGDPRVNVAHAHEIVTELGYVDSDPVWAQLDAECRSRG